MRYPIVLVSFLDRWYCLAEIDDVNGVSNVTRGCVSGTHE